MARRSYDLMTRRDIEAALDRYFDAHGWAATRHRLYADAQQQLRELDDKGRAEGKFVL